MLLLQIMIIITTLLLYYSKGQSYAETYKKKPVWSELSIFSFLFVSLTPAILLGIILDAEAFRTMLTILTVCGLIFSYLRMPVEESPDFLSSAFHGSLGGIFVWLGFKLGYLSILEPDSVPYTKKIDNLLIVLSDKFNGRSNHSLADELEKLKALHNSGAISDDEYKSAKEQILRKVS